MRKNLLPFLMMLISFSLYSQTTVTIGAGSNISGANDRGNPLFRSSSTSAFHHSKSVQILTSSDLAIATVPDGATISSIAYNKASTFNVSGTNKWTLNVYLKNSSATTVSSGTAWNTMLTGASLFYSGTIDANNNFSAAGGWVTWNNTTGSTFNYSGGAIEVYIEWIPNGTMVSPFTDGAFLWAYDIVNSGIQAMGVRSVGSILDTQNSYTEESRRYQTQLTYTAAICNGTPVPGNILSSNSPVCPGIYTTILSLQNVISGLGLSYQWYKNGAAINGATSSTYSVAVSTADTFYVTVTCGGSTGTSTPFTVLAPIPSIVPAYINNFTTFPGSCWLQASDGDPTTGSTGSSEIWFPSGFLNSGSTGAAKFNFFNSDRMGWLKTLAFDLSAGGFIVKFDYGLTEHDGSNPAIVGVDDYLQFIISTDGGNSWTVLQTWDKSTPISNTLNTFIYDLSAYTSTNNIFAFYATTGATSTGDYDFHLDNFVVEPMPLSINESSAINLNFNIYPNPFTDVVRISDVKDVVSISVVDMVGRVVKTVKPEREINLADLKSGMYLINLKMKDGSVKTVKAVKK